MCRNNEKLTTSLCKGRTWSRATNLFLPFDVTVMLTFSIAFPLTRTGMMMK